MSCRKLIKDKFPSLEVRHHTITGATSLWACREAGDTQTSPFLACTPPIQGPSCFKKELPGSSPIHLSPCRAGTCAVRSCRRRSGAFSRLMLPSLSSTAPLSAFPGLQGQRLQHLAGVPAPATFIQTVPSPHARSLFPKCSELRCGTILALRVGVAAYQAGGFGFYTGIGGRFWSKLLHFLA